MTKKELRSQILEKFRSITYFSKKSGIRYNTLLAYFNTEDYDSEKENIIKAYHNTEGIKDDMGLIKDSDRSAIRICILSNFNSYSDFCRAHKKYDVVYLTNVIKGRLKEESPKYRELVNTLTEECDLDPLILDKINKDII